VGKENLRAASPSTPSRVGDRKFADQRSGDTEGFESFLIGGGFSRSLRCGCGVRREVVG